LTFVPFNMYHARDPRSQRSKKKQAAFDYCCRTMLPLITGYDRNPAVVSLPSRVLRYSSRGQGKSRRIATVPAGLPFLIPISRFDIAAEMRTSHENNAPSNRPRSPRGIAGALGSFDRSSRTCRASLPLPVPFAWSKIKNFDYSNTWHARLRRDQSITRRTRRNDRDLFARESLALIGRIYRIARLRANANSTLNRNTRAARILSRSAIYRSAGRVNERRPGVLSGHGILRK